MNKLLSIRMVDFGSFVGEHEVQFGDGLTLFDGPSGSGKSTIFRAVAFCLGFCPLTAKDLQSSFSKDKFQVELRLLVDGSTVVISRGKENSLVVDGTVKTDASSELPKLLAGLLGSPETIEALTYRDQDKAFNFLDLSDSDKKDFVSPLVPGMAAIESELEFCSSQVQEKEAVYDALCQKEAEAGPIPDAPAFSKEDLQASKKGFEVGLSNLTELFQQNCLQIDRVQKVVENGIQGQIKEVKASKYDNSKQDQIKHVLEGCKEHLQECQLEIASIVNKRIDTYREELAAYTKYQTGITKLGELQTQLTKAQLAAETLNAGKCPTCRQLIKSPQLVIENDTLQADLKTKIQALESAAPVEKPASPDQSPPEHLATKNKNLTNKIGDLQGQLATEIAAQKSFELDIANEVKGLELKIRESKAEAVKTKADLESLYNKDCSGLQNQLAQVDKSLQDIAAYEKVLADRGELTKKVKLAKVDLEDWESYQKLLKGFKAHVFEELLGELADKTNEILSQLDNTADVVVEFRTIKEQTKSQKEVITPVFNFRGVERPLKTASGGMKLVIKFAVSLAVASVVASRTGKDLDWLMLDETFHSLNHEIRRQCLTILESYSKTKQVLMIDHGADFEALFSQVIRVENNNGQSRIT